MVTLSKSAVKLFTCSNISSYSFLLLVPVRRSSQYNKALEQDIYTYNSSFICIVVAPSILNIITYILHTIFHTSPVVLTVVTGRIWITIRPSSKDTRELKQPRQRRWRNPHFKKSAFVQFQTSSLFFCLVQFIKCSWIFLELRFKSLYLR